MERRRSNDGKDGRSAGWRTAEEEEEQRPSCERRRKTQRDGGWGRRRTKRLPGAAETAQRKSMGEDTVRGAERGRRTRLKGAATAPYAAPSSAVEPRAACDPRRRHS